MPISTILFDLDSTLIKLDESAFTRRYFHLLHDYYFPSIEINNFNYTLTGITKDIMLSKSRKHFTYKKFINAMAKNFQIPTRRIIEKFKCFYQMEYDMLRVFITPIVDSKALMKKCFKKDYEVVIATTPVFSEVAILKRMEWGGILDFDYKYITTAENMHFSKPREEYYIELLKRINRIPEECIMVGNEFIGDILAPTKIGIKTFYCPMPSITDSLLESIEIKNIKINPTYTGTLKDFSKLIDEGL